MKHMKDRVQLPCGKNVQVVVKHEELYNFALNSFRRCFLCGEIGHIRQDCSLLSDARDEDGSSKETICIPVEPLKLSLTTEPAESKVPPPDPGNAWTTVSRRRKVCGATMSHIVSGLR